jgi:hypothetical protein
MTSSSAGLPADYPYRVVRLAVGEAPTPGITPPNPLKLTADDVQTLVIPGIGHWLAEQAPDDLVAALTEFLALLPGRIGRGARRQAGCRRGLGRWPALAAS